MVNERKVLEELTKLLEANAGVQNLKQFGDLIGSSVDVDPNMKSIVNSLLTSGDSELSREQLIAKIHSMTIAIPIDPGGLESSGDSPMKGDLLESNFNTAKREELAKKGYAMKDGSYPIEDAKDLENAYKDCKGRGNGDASVKEHILKQAKRLGLEDEYEKKFSGKDDIKEAKRPDDMSHEDHINNVNKAVREKYQYEHTPIETHDDHVITQKYSDGKHYKTPVSYDKKGKCMLGDPSEVKRSFDNIKESINAVLIESVDKTGTINSVMLIKTGRSVNGYDYSEKLLRESVSLFDDVSAYADHNDPNSQKDRSIRDKVGYFSDASYGSWEVDGKLVEGIKGKFNVVSPWLRDIIRESVKMGKPQFVGLSINAKGKIGQDNIVESLTKIESVDVVSNASAGGQVISILESINGERQMDLNELKTLVAQLVKETNTPAAASTDLQESVASITKELREARVNAQITGLVNASTLSGDGKIRVIKQLQEAAVRRDLTEADITGAITDLKTYESAIAQKFFNPNSISINEGIKLGHTSKEFYTSRFQGMLEGNDVKIGDVRTDRFKSIRESYCAYTGKNSFEVDPVEMWREMTASRYDSQVDHKNIQESVNLAQWGSVFADNLYIQLIKAYEADEYYGQWTQVCSDIQDTPDFQAQHWVRVGGYADLGTVGEDVTYPQLTSFSDESVKYSLAKRGGVDDISFEAIVDDRVNSIRRIPLEMGRSASRTLYKFVFNLITESNPTMSYDSVTLYDSTNHKNYANSGSGYALSVFGVDASWVGMRQQTPFGMSSEILGSRNTPKILIVGSTLEMLANRIINPSDAYLAAINQGSNDAGTAGKTTDKDASLDPQAFKGRLSVIVYDQMSSQTVWYAVADPKKVPTMVVGFLNGKRAPELFIQDMPTVGGVFSSDKITYKIRHIYGGVVEDHRSFYRGN